MKEGPLLKQFHKRRGKEFKRLAAYMYKIFRKDHPKPYLTKVNKTYLYHTIRYPRLWRTVPILRYGIQS